MKALIHSFFPRRAFALGPATGVLFLLCLCLSLNHSLLGQSAATTHRKVLTKVEPEYPAVLRNGRFEGQVRLEVRVLANGAVSNVEIKGGSPIFSQYASEAVAKWKYAPAATQTTEEVVLNFSPNTVWQHSR